jgi:predicted dehydrogenase
MRKLKMAILGLGPIAQTVHLAALTKAHNVDLIAACDVAPDVLEPVAARYAISRTYSAADQLWVDPEYRTPSDPDSDPYQRQIEAFADAILAGRPVSPSAEDGLAAERVLYAIAESQSTNGRRIEI